MLTLNGPLTNNGAGSGGLTKTSAGMLVVAAPASYTGPTAVSAGTLQLSHQPVSGFGGSGTGWTVNSIGITSTPITSDVLTLTDNDSNEARSTLVQPVGFGHRRLHRQLHVHSRSGTFRPTARPSCCKAAVPACSPLATPAAAAAWAICPFPTAALGINIYSGHTVGAGYFTDGNMANNVPERQPGQSRRRQSDQRDFDLQTPSPRR